MKFQASWLSTAIGNEPWVVVGVLLRGDGRVSFHPRPGGEIPTLDLARACDRASDTDAEAVDDLWDYLMERGLGGLSSFTEPDEIEADDRPAAVAELMRSVPGT